VSLIPSTPLAADVDAALTRLEQAKSFDGLDADYALVDQEATKRTVPAFFAMLPAMALFAALVLGAYALGWILPDFWSYALWLLIVPFTALVTNALRGPQAVKDEQRIGKALDKWRDHADAHATSSKT
jgi:hypothetical protein